MTTQREISHLSRKYRRAVMTNIERIERVTKNCGQDKFIVFSVPFKSFSKWGNKVRRTPGSPRSVRGGTAPARNLIGSRATLSSFHSLMALGPPNFLRIGSKLLAPTLNLKDPSGTCMTQPSYFLYSMLSASPIISRICETGKRG